MRNKKQIKYLQDKQNQLPRPDAFVAERWSQHVAKVQEVCRGNVDVPGSLSVEYDEHDRKWLVVYSSQHHYRDSRTSIEITKHRAFPDPTPIGDLVFACRQIETDQVAEAETVLCLASKVQRFMTGRATASELISEAIRNN